MSIADLVRDFIHNFSPLVDSSTKANIILLLSNFRSHRTKRKIAEIILNMPIGAFLKEQDVILQIPGDTVTDMPTLEDLIIQLKNKLYIINILKGGSDEPVS
jgi:hypothetical protein